MKLVRLSQWIVISSFTGVLSSYALLLYPQFFMEQSQVYLWIMLVVSFLNFVMGYRLFEMGPELQNKDKDLRVFKGDIDLLRREGYRVWMPVPKTKEREDIENAMDNMRVRGLVVTNTSYKPVDVYIEITSLEGSTTQKGRTLWLIDEKGLTVD